MSIHVPGKRYRKGHWVILYQLSPSNAVAFPGDLWSEYVKRTVQKGKQRGSVFNWVINLLFYKKATNKKIHCKKHLKHELHRILEKYRHYLVNEISNCMIGSSLQSALFLYATNITTECNRCTALQQVKVLFSLRIIRRRVTYSN